MSISPNPSCPGAWPGAWAAHADEGPQGGGSAMDDKLKKKSFCRWDKEDIKESIDLIYELTAKPKFVCQNCARVARRKANLCKPKAFGPQKE
jgi:hypothetical protein